MKKTAIPTPRIMASPVTFAEMPQDLPRMPHSAFRNPHSLALEGERPREPSPRSPSRTQIRFARPLTLQPEPR